MDARSFDAPPILRRLGAGFADFTVTRRLPKIASEVADTLKTSSSRRAVAALVDDMIAGAPLERSPLPPVTPFLQRYFAARRGATWLDLPFFDLEFVFYLALNAIAGTFAGGPDVFRGVRVAARESALGALTAASFGGRAGEPPGRDELDQRLWHALLGNEADLSQLAVATPHAAPWTERLVVDQRPALLDRLAAAAGGGGLHLLADNAGAELLADLLLLDVVLRAGSRRIVIQAKPWPMFVSDARPDDVTATIEGLATHVLLDARAVGARLTAALVDGRLVVEAHAAWGEPRHFDNLDGELGATLAGAALVLAKGDLNYRRFTGDRAWPLATPPSVASAGVPFAAFALRVLKSDTLVGVTPAAATHAAALSSSWRTDGTHALVQELGAVSRPQSGRPSSK